MNEETISHKNFIAKKKQKAKYDLDSRTCPGIENKKKKTIK
jgi:hypothetical protein